MIFKPSDEALRAAQQVLNDRVVDYQLWYEKPPRPPTRLERILPRLFPPPQATLEPASARRLIGVELDVEVDVAHKRPRVHIYDAEDRVVAEWFPPHPFSLVVGASITLDGITLFQEGW